MSTHRFSSPIELHLERFESQFPFGAIVRSLFRSAGCDPMYAGPAPAVLRAPAGSWVLQVRLTARLEDSYGFTRQFVVYCLDVPDLQTRAVSQLKRLIESADPAVSTDFAMIVSRDLEGREKIRDWSVERSEGFVVLAVHPDEIASLLADGDPGQALPRLLDVALAARNLYDERDPVYGERFFGRSDELRELDRVISQGNRHVGIFGLRRIGKTSLLLELMHRLRKRPEVTPIFIDLELSSAVKSASHVAHRIGDSIAEIVSARSPVSLRGARRELGIPDRWDEIAGERLITDLGVRLVSFLKRGALADTRVVVVLDEAEILLPGPDRPAAHAIDLLRMIRGVSQETQQLTLVLAGVNATPSESPLLADEDNPLFGLLAVKYLGPLEQTACSDMIRVVGRRMRIRWESPALNAVTTHVGAHPLLARLAASDVVTTNPDRPLRTTAEMVKRVLTDFHRRHDDVFTQMVISLQRYYPDELEVLRLLATGERGFVSSVVADDPTILNHLRGYGVIDQESLEVSSPALAAWLCSHGRK